MQIAYLPEPERHPLWGEMKALLARAAAHGGGAAKDDDELVWIAFDGPTLFGIATTAMWDNGEAEIRNVAGARFKDWGRLMESALCEWARNCGAVRLTARGRKGWARVYRAFGWVALGNDEYKKEL